MGIDPFTPKDSYCRLVCLVWCPETLPGLALCLPGTCRLVVLTCPGSLSLRLAAPKMAGQRCRSPFTCVEGPIACCQASQPLFQSPFLLAIFGSDSIFWDHSIFVCLFLILPETFTVSPSWHLTRYLKWFFFKVTLWSKLGQIGSWYSELHKNLLQAFSSKLNENYVPKGKENIPKAEGSKSITEEMFDFYLSWRSPGYKEGQLNIM